MPIYRVGSKRLGLTFVCLQEPKAANREFPKEAIEAEGYRAVWRGEKLWNGVAILARGGEPIVTRTELPGDPEDGQSRYIEAAVKGVIIASLYAPNGNPQPGPKFSYKLAWLGRFARHALELYRAGVPVVLAGDYNVVPTPQDIYPTTSYATNALVQPEARAAFRHILDQGWVDAIRTLYPGQPMYTFWDYMRSRWERDAGLRLDHLLLSAEAAKRIELAGVDRDVRGEPNASDHAPAWIVLHDRATARRAPARGASTDVRSSRGGRRVARGGSAKRPAEPGRPLLVIDGDLFAHRSYTPCRRPFCAPEANRRELSSASQIFCYASIKPNGRALCWSGGIR